MAALLVNTAVSGYLAATFARSASSTVGESHTAAIRARPIRTPRGPAMTSPLVATIAKQVREAGCSPA